MRSAWPRRRRQRACASSRNSQALSIDPAGVRKRVTTAAGRVRAPQVVLACNAHLGSLLPRIAGTLVPVWSYVVTTKPLGPRLSEAIAYRGAVSDTDLANHHYRIVDGDRLLWSGRSTTWEGDPHRFAGKLKADIAAVYPQLGEVEIEHAWSGLLGNPLHRMPQIGELSPGLWLASGFGGHGLNTTAMAGNIIAQAIAENDDTWKLFAPFELVWAGEGSVARRCRPITGGSSRTSAGRRARHADASRNFAAPRSLRRCAPAPSSRKSKRRSAL